MQNTTGISPPYPLNNYSPRENQYHFLRIVSRVYVTGQVSVLLNNDEATGLEAAAGADRPVKRLGIVEGNEKENYNAAIEEINNIAAENIPGAKFKIASASSRSVMLNETFKRPLVIGYVGFDMPILIGGRLGAPISTLAQLTGQGAILEHSEENTYRLASFAHMYQALKGISGNEAERILEELNKLATLLPDRYPFTLYEVNLQQTDDGRSRYIIEKDLMIIQGAKVKRQDFNSLIDYCSNALSTVEAIESYLPNAPKDTEEQLNKISLLTGELGSAQAALEDIQEQLNKETSIIEAIDFVFLGI